MVFSFWLLIPILIFAAIIFATHKKTSSNPLYSNASKDLQVFTDDDINLSDVDRAVLSIPEYGNGFQPNFLKVAYLMRDGSIKAIQVNIVSDIFEERRRLQKEYEALGIKVEIDSAGSNGSEFSTPKLDKLMLRRMQFIYSFILVIAVPMLISTPNAKWRGGEPFSRNDKIIQFVFIGTGVIIVFALLVRTFIRKKSSTGTQPPLPPPF